jgi:hypothetical protein
VGPPSASFSQSSSSIVPVPCTATHPEAISPALSTTTSLVASLVDRKPIATFTDDDWTLDDLNAWASEWDARLAEAAAVGREPVGAAEISGAAATAGTAAAATVVGAAEISAPLVWGVAHTRLTDLQQVVWKEMIGYAFSSSLFSSSTSLLSVPFYFLIQSANIFLNVFFFVFFSFFFFAGFLSGFLDGLFLVISLLRQADSSRVSSLLGKRIRESTHDPYARISKHGKSEYDATRVLTHILVFFLKKISE